MTFEESELYVKNFQALEKKNKWLADLVDSKEPTQIKSFFDPENEYEDIKNRLKDFYYESNFLVVIGLAPYYHLKVFLEKYKKNIIIFEPRPDILKYKMYHFNFTEILQNPQIQITNSIRQLNSYISENYHGWEEGQLHCCGTYYHLEPTLLELVRRSIEAQSELINLINNTLIFHGEDWCKHFFWNIPHFKANNSARDTDNIYKGKDQTCVIVGTGDSVDKSLELLYPYKNMIHWFVCDVASSIMKKNDIQPDVIFTLEKNEFSTSKIDVETCNNSSLFLGDIANPLAYNIPSKNKFIIYQDGTGMNEQFCSRYNLKQVAVGSTVLSVAFQCAINMGFKTIIIIGSDFCFKGDERYSKSLSFSNIHSFKKDIKNVMGDSFDENIFNDGVINCVRGIENIYGEDVSSYPAYLASRKWIGRTALLVKDTNLFNITNGIPLQGFKNIPLRKVASISEVLSFTNNKEDLLSSFKKIHNFDEGDYTKNILEKLKIIISISEIISKQPMTNDIKSLYSKLNDTLLFLIDEDKMLNVLFLKETKQMNILCHEGSKKECTNKEELMSKYFLQYKNLIKKAGNMYQIIQGLHQ